MKGRKIFIVMFVGVLLVCGLFFIGCDDDSYCSHSSKDCYSNQSTNSLNSCGSSSCYAVRQWYIGSSGYCDC